MVGSLLPWLLLPVFEFDLAAKEDAPPCALDPFACALLPEAPAPPFPFFPDLGFFLVGNAVAPPCPFEPVAGGFVTEAPADPPFTLLPVLGLILAGNAEAPPCTLDPFAGDFVTAPPALLFAVLELGLVTNAVVPPAPFPGFELGFVLLAPLRPLTLDPLLGVLVGKLAAPPCAFCECCPGFVTKAVAPPAPRPLGADFFVGTTANAPAPPCPLPPLGVVEVHLSAPPLPFSDPSIFLSEPPLPGTGILLERNPPASLFGVIGVASTVVVVSLGSSERGQCEDGSEEVVEWGDVGT